jgi:DNA-binding NarL/FixJ family response regulator
MDKVSILIADDHPIFRSGVKEILLRTNKYTIVAEVSDGLEAYRQIIAKRPNIAILDYEMPLLTGLDVAKKVLNEKSFTDIVILTMHKEKEYLKEAMLFGVKGYLIKDNAENDLILCLEKLLNGEKYISEILLNEISFDTEKNEPLQSNSALDNLSPTEKIILKLIAEGNTSNEISKLLFISPHTVENHRSNITKKLKLEGKNSLLKFAMANISQLK